MKLEHLEYFCKITPGLSLNKLSERMHISVQCLSASIKILENELDCQLLERTTKVVFFTKEGEEFFYYTKAYLDNIHSLQSKFSQLSGELIIPTMPIAISNFLDRVTEVYLKENPKVELKFRYDSSSKKTVAYLDQNLAEFVFCSIAQFKNSQRESSILADLEKDNYYFQECKKIYCN